MKKIIIIALLGLVYVAQAEINTYGFVDTGLSYTRQSQAARTFGFRSDHQSVSFLGISGEEYLQKGLSATYRLELPFSLSSDNSRITHEPLFGRHATIGLSNPAWGSMTVGTQTGVGADFLRRIDLFAHTPLAAEYTIDSSFAFTPHMTFKYVAPPVSYVQLAWSWGGRSHAKGQGVQRYARSIGALFDYEGWLATVTYQEDNNARFHHVGAGLSYHWQWLKVSAWWTKARQALPNLFTFDETVGQVSSWSLGAQFRLEHHRHLSLSYAHAKSADRRVNQYQALYRYAWSNHLHTYTYYAYHTLKQAQKQTAHILGLGISYRF